MKSIFLTFLIVFAATEISRSESLQDLTLQLSADSLKAHVEILAHDDMQGRATGSYGERLAGDYIIDRLRAYDVAPAVMNRSYEQLVPLHGSTALPSSEVTLFTDTESQTFHLGDDYVFLHAGAQNFIPHPAELCFIGYGITAPEYDYNDYQNIDVRGKIVVYLSGEPFSEDDSYFDGARATIYSYPESKERLALAHGARGSILIPNPYEQPMWEIQTQQFAFEDVRLAYSATRNVGVMMNPMAAGALFANAPYSLDDIFKMRREHTIKSFPLNVRASIKAESKNRDFLSRNIIGSVRGSNPQLRNSYIIISAHYDHLGIGTPVRGDSIYNGAIDNAIGVAALLEMARLFQQNPPKRSLLFLFVTGEEKGALGSTFYVNNPVRPLYKTVANINVDGLATIDLFKDIIGYGAELSSLGAILSRTAKQLELQASEPPSHVMRLESFARSDQIVFAKAGIPSILIMEGLNYQSLSYREGLKKQIEWMGTIYHTPFDDIEQEINWRAAQLHCRALVEFVHLLGDDENEPHWNPGSPFMNARLQSIAEKR